MVCSPNDVNVNPVIPPPFSVPGFGNLFAPFQIPLPNLDLPTSLVEDIVALINQLGALFPSGLFKPQVGFPAKTVLDMIMSLLSQIAPWLSFYKFILAALQLIICIIQCLCALPNPFAFAAKLLQLFNTCLPPFLLLFPWLALIAMIIALLLLILALITYLIETILAVILAIIANIEVLAAGLQLQDAQSTLAAIQKIAALLCFIQNLLAVLVAIAAIISIIEALASFAGAGICDDNDPDGCCTPPTCPPFVKLTPNGIPVSAGQLIYHKQIGTDVKTLFASLNIPGIENLLNVPLIRPERWQVVANLGVPVDFPISDIIIPVFDPAGFLTGNLSGNIFYPTGVTFTKDTSKNQSPYTVDLRVELDPAQFGLTDLKGKRFFQIKDAIVVREPYFGIMDQDQNISLVNPTGTLNIEGGLVFEDDGTTKYLVSGKQASINTLIHNSPLAAGSNSDIPATNDAIVFDNISFTWKPNAPALAGYNLVTFGCIPAISVEKAVQNNILLTEGITPVIQRIVPLTPDINGAIVCTNNSIAKFRKNITTQTAAEFQAEMVACLGKLRDETQGIICAAIITATSQFKSTVTLDTDVQFTTRGITASVVLKDPTATTISDNIPAACVPQIEAVLSGHVTFGSISSFKYDGSHQFNATITSPDPGTGTLSVSFNGKIFNTVTPGNNSQTTVIDTLELPFTFISGVTEPVVRRDETDTARE